MCVRRQGICAKGMRAACKTRRRYYHAPPAAALRLLCQTQQTVQNFQKLQIVFGNLILTRVGSQLSSHSPILSLSLLLSFLFGLCLLRLSLRSHTGKHSYPHRLPHTLKIFGKLQKIHFEKALWENVWFLQLVRFVPSFHLIFYVEFGPAPKKKELQEEEEEKEEEEQQQRQLQLPSPRVFGHSLRAAALNKII